MKKTLHKLAPFGFALLACFAAAPASRASILVDDIVSPFNSTEDPAQLPGGATEYQGFSTPAGTGVYAALSSVLSSSITTATPAAGP